MDTVSAALELEPHLIALEKRAFAPATRRSRELLAFLIHKECIEVDVAGRERALEERLVRLPDEAPVELESRDFRVRQLAANLCQVLYRAKLIRGTVVSHSHRSSLWTLEDHRWQMIHHQETPCRPF
ncbi:nuclear transport factor 2 family protein [Ferrimonas sediminicola]|uniref:Nuclear transport factor 2 family protein n=1 Tax=Ferrimonas sediminicola TaxID=2569538 RepID=A0A4U1BC13_9GAMM|nr:nuclear transport factor 2 family protein [Ferrimonas sediminicola]TKB48538.1 nuclear transport factor 2 family protein [Ferrimonas sediminicola]